MREDQIASEGWGSEIVFANDNNATQNNDDNDPQHWDRWQLRSIKLILATTATTGGGVLF